VTRVLSSLAHRTSAQFARLSGRAADHQAVGCKLCELKHRVPLLPARVYADVCAAEKVVAPLALPLVARATDREASGESVAHKTALERGKGVEVVLTKVAGEISDMC
jgi:hypothetical protein